MDAVLYGDCLTSLRSLAALGVKAQMCVTSPPYFGLRSYLDDSHADKALEIGLEETPEQFIAALVEVFRAVRDVLADDGTLWVNIGDSYASGGRGGGGAFNKDRGNAAWKGRDSLTGWRSAPEGMKAKDLIGIPWMLAFALRADGWYLRQDIIWHKPNPMPESVTDRCTKAHEYLFLLSKSPKYFYDANAIRMPLAEATIKRIAQNVARQAGSQRANGGTREGRPMKAVGGSIRSHDPETFGLTQGKTNQCCAHDSGANRRSVWSVATRPYKGAHFATFPPALIEPCILAGSRPGDVVLDPFMGSGTTAATSKKLGRQYLGCELNAANAPLIAERLADA